MEIWNWIAARLANEPIYLLWVAWSEGSSPGRKGFAMAVTHSDMFGTIGGGVMEQKLVELAKSKLARNELEATFIEQYHDKNHSRQRSGMICSGAQAVILFPLQTAQTPIIEEIIAAWQHKTRDVDLCIGVEGIWLLKADAPTNFECWYRAPLLQKQRIHIVGGGHTGLALSQIMHFLDFEVLMYDDRPNLNTMRENNFTTIQKIIDYEDANSEISTSENDFLAIMTVGYRTDKIVLKQLIDRPLRYLGMLGSKAKIATLRAELLAEGMSEAQWSRVHSPIGLNIKSETVQEIAVSIAAQIIQIKNSV